MADFYTAFEKTGAHEGAYSDHPDDRGGETYRGIARRFHPNWNGWERIDAAKKSGSFPYCLELDSTLQRQVEEFYKEEFWKKIGGDSITHQGIANELYDTAVNMSPERAVKFLQIALNALNKNQRLYQDVAVDGAMGGKTLMALTTLLARDGALPLLKLLNAQQGAHYLRLMQNSPSQETFAYGWLNRVWESA